MILPCPSFFFEVSIGELVSCFVIRHIKPIRRHICVCVCVCVLSLMIGLCVYGLHVAHCASLEQVIFAIKFSFEHVYIKPY